MINNYKFRIIEIHIIFAKGIISSHSTILYIHTCIHTYIHSMYNVFVLLYSSWISDMLAQILSDEIANDVAGAEAQVDRTANHKAEVEAREDHFVNIKSTNKLLSYQASKFLLIKGNDTFS